MKALSSSLVRRAVVVGSVLAGLALGGCGSSGGASSTQSASSDEDLAEFAAAVEAWSDHDGRYSMTYTASCGEGPFFTDTPIAVVGADGNAVVADGSDAGIELVTVELLFEQIESALDEADVVDVSYGDQGYPELVFIDWIVDAIDDEFCVDISSFELS